MPSGGRRGTMWRRTGARPIGRAPISCPSQRQTPQPIVAIYAARVGRWRGIFAHHSWVVVKEAGAARYTRYDKVGWGSPVRTDGWPPDGALVRQRAAADRRRSRRGGRTARSRKIRGRRRDAIRTGAGAITSAWPGPNSNTFVAHVMRSVPELGAALPPTAIGKDWQPADGHRRPDAEPARESRSRSPGSRGFRSAGSRASRSTCSASSPASTSAAQPSSFRLGPDRARARRPLRGTRVLSATFGKDHAATRHCRCSPSPGTKTR